MNFNEEIEVRLLSCWGGDREIAEAAWVSTGLNATRRPEEDVVRLVHTLAKEGHGVPFEAVCMRFYVKCPRYIETQIVKHRISSINAASARYRKVTTGCLSLPDDVAELLGEDAAREFGHLVNVSNLYYSEWMTNAKHKYGVGSPEYKRIKEVVRGVLPQAQMTELHMMLNLRSFANFYKQRASTYAQKEIREVAEQMLAALVEAGVAPEALKALAEKEWQI